MSCSELNKSNMDISYCLKKFDVIAYMTKYVTKAENKSCKLEKFWRIMSDIKRHADFDKFIPLEKA